MFPCLIYHLIINYKLCLLLEREDFRKLEITLHDMLEIKLFISQQ